MPPGLLLKNEINEIAEEYEWFAYYKHFDSVALRGAVTVFNVFKMCNIHKSVFLSNDTLLKIMSEQSIVFSLDQMIGWIMLSRNRTVLEETLQRCHQSVFGCVFIFSSSASSLSRYTQSDHSPCVCVCCSHVVCCGRWRLDFHSRSCEIQGFLELQES